MMRASRPSGDFSCRLRHFQGGPVELERLGGGKLQAAADFAPGAGERGKGGDRADGRAAVLAALDAVVQADRGGTRGRVLAGKLDDIFFGDAGEGGDAIRRIIRAHAIAQRLESVGVAGDVIGVVKFFADDDVHQAERERQIAPGWMRRWRSASAAVRVRIGIDHDQLRAVAPRFDDKRPQMHVGAVNVRGPGDDEFRMAELFRLGSIA